jgi:hypothetical protein
MTSALKKGGSPRGYLARVRALELSDYLVCTPVRETYQHPTPLDFDPLWWACVSAPASDRHGTELMSRPAPMADLRWTSARALPKETAA